MPMHDRRGPVPPLHRRPNQGGVALIEVLVAILLFSFAILGLVGLQAQAIALSLEADYRGRASVLADEIAGQMWLNKTVDLNSVDASILTKWKAKVADSTTGRLPSGAGSVSIVSTAAGGVPTADIVVSWKPPSRPSGDVASSFTTRVALPSL